MSTALRTPFLIAAAVLSFVVIGIETGTGIGTYRSVFQGLGSSVNSMKNLLPGGKKQPPPSVSSFKDLEKIIAGGKERLPGFAAGSLINIDICLAVTMLLMVLPLLMSPDAVSRLQGPIYLVTGLIMLFGAFILIIKALVSLVLMIMLLLSIPFGTIIYMIMYAFFDTSRAALIIHTLFGVKIALTLCLLAASELFLKNIGLLLIIGTSLLCMMLINILHNFPPVFLVSITDALAAILVSVIAILWAIVFIVSGIVGVIKAIKTSVSLQSG